MNTFDLERFKKIPRNDVLSYLYQNYGVDSNIMFRDVFDRINKPINIFCFVIDDLIRIKLIECKNYFSKKSDFSGFFPDYFSNVEIKLTPLGKHYTESIVLGFNPDCYGVNDEIHSFKFGGFSGRSLSEYFQKSFFEIDKIYSAGDMDAKDFYYLLTGLRYKENKEKKVFISYSHDNEDHKNWINKLAQDLENEFTVEFDKYLTVGISPYLYMKSNILSSDYVVIVFTNNYREKVYQINDSGVKIEFSIIQEDLFRKISNGKYIPLLKEGDKNSSIPTLMEDAIYLNFTDSKNYNKNLKLLIERLSNHI